MTQQPISQIPNETLGAIGWDIREQIDNLNAQLLTIRTELQRRNQAARDAALADQAAAKAASAPSTGSGGIVRSSPTLATPALGQAAPMEAIPATNHDAKVD